MHGDHYCPFIFLPFEIATLQTYVTEFANLWAQRQGHYQKDGFSVEWRPIKYHVERDISTSIIQLITHFLILWHSQAKEIRYKQRQQTWICWCSINAIIKWSQNKNLFKPLYHGAKGRRTEIITLANYTTEGGYPNALKSVKSWRRGVVLSSPRTNF